MSRFIPLSVLALATVAMLVGARERAHGTSHALILQAGDGERLIHTSGPLKGLPFIIKVDSENGSAEDFFVFTETLAPGQTIPFHNHHNAEELLLLEEGGVTVMVGDRWAVAGPRSMVFIPRDTWISATNKSKQDVHVVAVFSRQGFERYMRAIGAKPGAPVSPVSPSELPRLRALGHATYWDTAQGPYPPGVAHP